MKKFKDIQVGDMVGILSQEEAAIFNVKVVEVQKEETYVTLKAGNLIGVGYLEEFTGRVFDPENGRRLTDLRVFASPIKMILKKT